MNMESSIQSVRKIHLRSESTPFNQQRQSFNDIFQRTLNSKSNSRPPKIELTGLLVPCQRVHQGQIYKFKLETDFGEYFLCLGEHLVAIAQRAVWDEVTVKGCLDFDSNVFEVEKIILTQNHEPELAS